MKEKLRGYSLALIVILLCLGFKIVFSEDADTAAGNNVNSDTLKQMQGRGEAMGEAMQEAQLKQLESKVETKKLAGIKGGISGFGNLLSRAHPYLTSKTQFDDNIYSTNTDIKSRLTYKNTLGAKMNFYGRGRSLNLDMYINDNRYQHVRLDNTQDNTTQDINLSLLTNLPVGRYNLSISDNVFSNYVGKTDEFGKKVDALQYYSQNTFAAKLGRGFNRAGFDINYQRINYAYEPEFMANSRVEETYGFNPYLKVGRKTKLQAGYSYNSVGYTHNLTPSLDSNYNDFNLTATGVLSAKVTGLAKMDYKLTNSADALHTRERTFTTKISYMASVRTSLALIFDHFIKQSSTESDYTLKDTFDLTGSHRLAFNPKFKLSLSGNVDYEKEPKQPISNKTHTYTLGSGLAYAFRQWLDFSLDYTNKRVKSNVADNYGNNTVIAKIQARF
jgi:hypothetical protein